MEVILLAAEALAALGVSQLSIDLNLSTLVPAVIAGLGLEGPNSAALIEALDRRDAGAVTRLAGSHGKFFGALLRAAGPARGALAALQRLDLPPAGEKERQRLAEVVDLLLAAAPDLVLSIDPVEHRGLEYHSGVGFTLLARRVRGELGRGGRYVSGKGEPSTGFTLYLDTLLRALPMPEARRRLFLPPATSRSAAAAWRKKGWVTVAGLEPIAEIRGEARRLGCTHYLKAGRALAVEE